MAEIEVSGALEQLIALEKEEEIILGREFERIKNELQIIQPFLRDAERRAERQREEEDGKRIRSWLNTLIEICFRIQDVVDKYRFYMPHPTRQIGILAGLTKRIKILKIRPQIASEIKDINSTLQEISKLCDLYGTCRSNEEGSSSTENKYVQEDPRMASLFIEEAEVFGLEQPKRQLIDWLVGGEVSLSVISVVGMGGLGKTTLAQTLYNSQGVIDHFDFRGWIIVSQSYTRLQLLREMMVQLYKARREPLPENLSGIDELTLVTEIRDHLQRIRYVVFFDDVWLETFWNEFELVLPDNNKRSRVVITTRNKHVADNCNTSFTPLVYELNPLSSEDSWELFCKKAFRAGSRGRCPPELIVISKEIIGRCKGLPLAIVAMAGLLATKKKTKDEWQKLLKNFSSQLDNNTYSSQVTMALGLSYDHLPHHLKSCLLYIGIYPEDYAISCTRLTRLWMAEGFVKSVEGKTLEQVAEGYLVELIDRCLVKVSLVHLDGRPKICGIHDLIREFIIRKTEDLSFCHFVSEHGDRPLHLDKVIRRLVMSGPYPKHISYRQQSNIQSIYIFNEGGLPESVLTTLLSSFKLLKVFDSENSQLNTIPSKLGSLYHLRYLSLRNTNIRSLPKSIGMLLNLETLDLRQTLVDEMPTGIKYLTKLRLLLAYCQNKNKKSSWTVERGIKIKNGIGRLTSLQKLYHVQANHGGIDLIRELGKLTQLRKLGLKDVRSEYGNPLCTSINKMSDLESLDISAISQDETIYLLYIYPLKLRKLCLRGRLEGLPDWVPKLQFLVKLTMAFSKLKDDLLKSLKKLPNLLDLSICHNAYDGEVLHFQEGNFQKLKNLFLERLDRLNSIVIENGALPLLEKFEIWSLPKLKEVPLGIHYLDSLQVLDLADLPVEFNQRIDPDGGEAYWMIKHVPVVYIRYKFEPRIGIVALDTRTIKHSRPKQIKNALVSANFEM